MAIKKIIHIERNKEVAPSIVNPVSTGPTISSFCLNNVSYQGYKRYVANVWEYIKENISGITLCKSRTLLRRSRTLLASIDEREHIELTHIHTLVEKYIKEVMNY